MSSRKSHLEEKFLTAWRAQGIAGSEPEREYRFHPTRKWRFDFAWPAMKLAVEIDGHALGHTSIVQRTRDAEKSNAAIVEGWRVLRFTGRQIEREMDGCLSTVLEAAMGARQEGEL